MVSNNNPSQNSTNNSVDSGSNDTQIESKDTTISEKSNTDASSARRKLFSLGLPAAAALLATACGKAVFGGEQKRISKTGGDNGNPANGDDDLNPNANNTAANNTAANSTGANSTGANNTGTNSTGANSTEANTAGGNGAANSTNSPLGNENMTGENSGTGNAGSANGGMNSGTNGGSNGGNNPTTVNPCDGIGLTVVDVSKIDADDNLLDSTVGDSKGIKIWGRESSALIALVLAKSTPKDSTILLTAQKTTGNAISGSSESHILATWLVANEVVDITGDSAMIVFENINLKNVSKLIIVVLDPNNTAKKIEIPNTHEAFILSTQSKRFASTFKGKKVFDVQPDSFADHASATQAQKDKFIEHSPTFELAANTPNAMVGSEHGFGHARNTTAAFRAVSIRTAGYVTDVESGNPNETAHITHAKTIWNVPVKFSKEGNVICDLAGREITSKFSGSTTNYLKDDYNFVVYVPDSSTTPEFYYRYMISVG